MASCFNFNDDDSGSCGWLLSCSKSKNLPVSWHLFWQMFCLPELGIWDQWPPGIWQSILWNLHHETGCPWFSNQLVLFSTSSLSYSFRILDLVAVFQEEVVKTGGHGCTCELPSFNPLSILPHAQTQEIKLTPGPLHRMLPLSSDCFFIFFRMCYKKILFLNFYVVNIIDLSFHRLFLVLIPYISACFWFEKLSPKSCLLLILQTKLCYTLCNNTNPSFSSF